MRRATVQSGINMEENIEKKTYKKRQTGKQNMHAHSNTYSIYLIYKLNLRIVLIYFSWNK